MKPAIEFVRYALSINALELVPGLRQLKSGRMSPYFFNSGLFKTGDNLRQLAQAYAAAMYANSEIPDVIFGPAYKGIPIAVAVALEMDCQYAFNRKEAKDHGEGGIIVGASLKDLKVAIVDDVMTTGTSSGEAVEIVRAQGGIPICCAIAFDRQEKGKESEKSAVQEFEKNYGIPVHAAATFADLIEATQNARENVSFILPQLLAYQKEYGA